MDNAHGPKSAYIQPSMDNEWIDIITYFRVQRNLRMAASDFVAPLLTGEKKMGVHLDYWVQKVFHNNQFNIVFTQHKTHKMLVMVK